MDTNIDKFKEIINNLISGQDGTTIQNFSGNSLQEFAEHQDMFWDGLLTFLQEESNTDRLNHFGVRDVDFLSGGDPTAATQSVVEYINNNADLVDSFLDSLFAISEEKKSHWNESFNSLIDLYYSCTLDTNDIADTPFTMGDIKGANAGNNFNNGQWVIPWINMDENNYSEVRNNDKIVRVLNNKERLQFTHLFNKFLRLLMPEYERVVEVEDLNRNFWVIGQVLSAILAYLFNPDNPLKDLIDHMLDEITQLWNNLLYLWVAFTLISQYTACLDIQPIVIPISVEELKPYVKYDGFSRTSMTKKSTSEELIEQLQICWNSLSYLKNIYNKSTLFIIPIIRNGSYQHNYHNEEYCPGMIVYDRRSRSMDDNYLHFRTDMIDTVEEEQVSYLPFVCDLSGNQVPLSVTINEDGFSICSKTWTNYTLTGVCEKSPYNYYTNNYQQDTNEVADGNYVAAIRMSFGNITMDGSSDFFDSQGLSHLTIDCTFDDAIAKLIAPSSTPLYKITFSLNSVTKQLVEDTIVKNDNQNTIQSEKRKITTGWYRGEVASWYHINETKFNTRIEINWSSIPLGYYEGRDAHIILTGVDDLGFETDPISLTVEQPHSDTITRNTVSVQAFSPTGRIANYTLAISGFDSSGWLVTGGEEVINYDSSSRVFHINIECIDFVDYVYDDNIIVYYTGTSGDPGEVPTENEGTTLTELGPSVFNGRDDINSIIIPDGITTID